MMTKSSEYALRALVFLVQHKDRWPIPGREIAKGIGVPVKYLQKILGDLTRAGVLESAPGRSGGFRLDQPAKRIPLLDILTPFERFELGRCPFGNAVCSDDDPCGAHHAWKKVVEAEQRFYREMSIEDVAVPKATKSKRRSGRAGRRGTKRSR